MITSTKATLPLAASVALLTFAWIEFAANFTFHWFTDGDLGIGLSLPGSFRLVIPAAFVSWAMFFAAGGDNAALRKTAIATVAGGLGGLVLMFLVPRTADLSDFWAIAMWAAFVAFAVVLGSILGDWYFVPGIVVAFASVPFWWMATGMDGWSPDGGGIGNSLSALGDSATAGTGAFGGVISTPFAWVFVNATVSMLAGCGLGIASVRLASAFTPKPYVVVDHDATV